MISIANNSNTILNIKKSKFYSFCYFVSAVGDVDAIISKLKAEYPDSTHICYAYVLHAPNIERAYDDGEPDGTAGKPIIDVIKKRRLSNVLVVVVRYFGGIKLGAGGLVRAYSSACSEVLDVAGEQEYQNAYFYTINFPLEYSKEGLYKLQHSGARITSTVYGEQLQVKYYTFDKQTDDYECIKLMPKREV